MSVSNWVWVIPLAILAFVFLLFPTGRLRSPRWRRLPGWRVVLLRWPWRMRW
jgi:hypothetical protein